MRNRWLLILCCVLFATPLSAQRHGVLVTGGLGLPNQPIYSYLFQPTLGMGYLCEWPQEDGWQLGLRGDVLATRQAIAGTRYSLALTIEEKLWRSFYEVLEVGLSFYTNPYPRSHNTDNLFIGSWVNCHIGVGLRYRHAVDSTHQLTMGFRFVHSSNAYLRKPNQGLNYLQAEMGFHIGAGKPRRQPTMADTTLPDLTFFCSYAPSVVQQRGPFLDDPYRYAHSFILGALHPFSRLRSLGGEVDLMYNYTHDLDADWWEARHPFPLYMGVCITYQRNWHPLFLRVSVGTDLIRSPYQIDDVYERISLNYRVAHWGKVTPYVGVACKAYYTHIDYAEWTLGVEF